MGLFSSNVDSWSTGTEDLNERGVGKGEVVYLLKDGVGMGMFKKGQEWGELFRVWWDEVGGLMTDDMALFHMEREGMTILDRARTPAEQGYTVPKFGR